MKKAISILICVLCLFTAGICFADSSTTVPDSIYALYTAQTVEYNGYEFPASVFFKDDFSIELHRNGTCVFTCEGQTADLNWTLIDTTFIMSDAGSNTLFEGTLEHGKINLTVDGVTFILCATDDNNDLKESSATEPEPAAGIQSYISRPLVYTGSGDSVIQIDYPDSGIWVLYVKGNASSRHFAVKGYDAYGNYTELFVNTTSPYEGITFDPDQSTVQLEIKATGQWRIEVRSVRSCDSITDRKPYEGKGDSVLLVNSTASTAYVEGNRASRHFAVKSYGDRRKLLVNTTDPYTGTVLLQYNPTLFVIKATDDWMIELR